MFREGIAALVLSAALISVPAEANDPRLVERKFDPRAVVRVEGRVNVQTTIRFGDDEQIENVAVGDSDQWQVTPNRRANHLFVKPLAPRAATNMTVVTTARTYLFDLVANPNHRNPLYVLTFTFPEPPAPAEPAEPRQLAEALPEGPNALELAAANDDLAIVDPITLNHQWAKTGTAELLPEMVHDDGAATFLTWPADAPLPAILIKDDEGTEGPVNFAVRGDVIVLDLVPREIVLRSGNDVALLVNQGPARQRSGG